MKTIILDDIADYDWDAIENLFGGQLEIGGDISEEDYEKLLEGSEALVQVEDFFGWDFVRKLKDGRIIYEDRNAGIPQITESPVEDVQKFVKKFLKILKQKFGTLYRTYYL